MSKYGKIINDNKGSENMALNEVKITAKALEKRKKRLKTTKRIVICLFLLLLAVFFVLMIVYKGGNFTVSLDPNFSLKSGLVLYESLDNKTPQNKLYAEELEFMDNISENWLPANINDEADGSHNGDNYIAYTFYVANEGTSPVNYWYQINILDVIKNVDEAIRIKLYLNGIPVTYAQKNSLTNENEPNTEAFYSDDIAILKSRKNLEPNQNDKYTVVIYLEGDDPDCVDAIIGGEIKLNMEFREEHTKTNEWK